jgi:multidrug efflux pump subunit AcrA (membrane-fusion protein)
MKFRTTIIAIVAIAVAATGAYMWWGMGGKGGDGKPDRGSQPVLVTLTQARTQEFVDLIEAVGTAKANESIELTAKSTDTVARLNFTDGQKVAAGYVVAEMSSREQSADITAAEATLKEQEQTLHRQPRHRQGGPRQRCGPRRSHAITHGRPHHQDALRRRPRIASRERWRAGASG